MAGHPLLARLQRERRWACALVLAVVGFVAAVQYVLASTGGVSPLPELAPSREVHP